MFEIPGNLFFASIDRPTIARDIDRLKSRGSSAWLEIIYEGDEIAGDLSTRLDEAVAGSGLEILRVKNNEDLAELVTRHMLQVAGITQSETLIAFQVFSRHDLERMFAIGAEK